MSGYLSIFSKGRFSMIGAFLREETPLIRRRMLFFGLLVAVVYALGTLMFTLLLSYGFTAYDAVMLFVVTGLCGVYVFTVRRLSSIYLMKAVTFIFITLFVMLLASDHIIMSVPFPDLLLSYLISLFSACLIIPWLPIKVLVVSAMILGVYSFHFHHSAILGFSGGVTYGGREEYSLGLVFLFMSFAVCFLARGYSTKEAMERSELNRQLNEKNRQMSAELELASARS